MKTTKKIIPFCLLLLLAACVKEKRLPESVQADVNSPYVLSEDNAREIATKFDFFEDRIKSNQPNRSNAIGEMNIMPDAKGLPAYYVFNYANEGGFLILSADRRQHAILGYNDQGHFDVGRMPSALQALVSEEIQEISDLRAAGNTTIVPEASASWATISVAATSSPASSIAPPVCVRNEWNDVKNPLLATTWGQTGIYNDLCPEIFGECSPDSWWEPPTGCVATAMAQLMAYYKWPTTYNWSLMPNTVGSKETAKLMLDAGTSVDMRYGCKSSSASVLSVPTAMKGTFKYTSSSIVSYSAAGFTDQQSTNVIVQQLKANKPVLLSAEERYAGVGHVWVADGFRRGGNCAPYAYLHMNWGWDGLDNGFFDLNTWKAGGGDFSKNRRVVLVGK